MSSTKGARYPYYYMKSLLPWFYVLLTPFVLLSRQDTPLGLSCLNLWLASVSLPCLVELYLVATYSYVLSGLHCPTIRPVRL